MDMEVKESDEHRSAKKSDALVPEGLLPSYLAEAFADLYGEDGLLVLGKGLGWLSLLAVFVRFYGDVNDGHASLVNDNDNGDVNESSKKSKYSVQCSAGQSNDQRPYLPFTASEYCN